jgi:glycosyltransferase involved in cell wall biosynthesis
MPNETPLITAVMIFLNGEKYIAEAIDSILAQTYEHWELILVDDGSTDGATAIARDYAARHPAKIRYIEHPNHENRGMSASRNAGVAAGTGEYISFLDADDIWLPERLERFVEMAHDYPEAGMIYGPTLYWYSWAEARGEQSPVEGQADFPGYVDVDTDELLPVPDVLRRFLITEGGCLPGICSLLIRRDAFESIGGLEEEFKGMFEDQVFLSKMTANHPVVVIEEVLDYYRQHSESCCWKSRVSDKGLEFEDLNPMRGVYLRWLKGYLKQIGLRDPVIDRQVRRQLIRYRIPFYLPIIMNARKLKRALRPAYRKYAPRSLKWVLWKVRVAAEDQIDRRAAKKLSSTE